MACCSVACMAVALARITSVAGLLLLGSCLDDPEAAPAIRLPAKVTLQASTECITIKVERWLSLSTTADGYLLAATAPIQCNVRVMKPFLTPVLERRSTLVLYQPAQDMPSSCECLRSIQVAIRGHVAPGDTIYVLNDHKVLGHVIVPMRR